MTMLSSRGVRGLLRWQLLPLTLVFVTLLPDGRCHAQPPQTGYCEDREKAEEAFEQGFRLFHTGGRRGDAEGLFCQATCCWPHPSADVEVRTTFFKTSYLPFYWRARSLVGSGEPDICGALRNLNLAVCEEKALDDESVKSSIDAQLKSLRPLRGVTPGEYQRGVEAFKRRRWGEAARYMLEAVRRWDEDGEGQRAQGRWPGTYLPRYYLARSLLELGCYGEAAGVLRCSEVSRCQLRGQHGDDPSRVQAEIEQRLAVNEATDEEVCRELRTEVRDLALEECCECAG